MKSVTDYIKKRSGYNTVETLINGRTGYSPKVNKILEKFGDAKITGITIHREVVPSVLTAVLGGLSFGEFTKNKEKSGLGKLFHLRLDFTTDRGKVLFEKNETINASIDCFQGKGCENLVVGNVPAITINQFLEKGLQLMGNDKYFKYSSKDNNCQNWVLEVLKANGIQSQEVSSFVKQDTAKLFEGLDGLRKISNTVTDGAAKLDVVMQGGSVYTASCGKRFNIQMINGKRHVGDNK